MSDTPRSDTEEAMYALSSVNSWGMGGWDFARTLERELASLRAEVEALREAALAKPPTTLASTGSEDLMRVVYALTPAEVKHDD